MKKLLITGILIVMSFSAYAEKGELKPEFECQIAKRLLDSNISRADKYWHTAKVKQEMFDVVEAYMATLEEGSPKHERALEGRNDIFQEFDRAYDRMEESKQKANEIRKRMQKHCYDYPHLLEE